MTTIQKVKNFLIEYKNVANADGRNIDYQRATALLNELEGLSISVGLTYEEVEELMEYNEFDWNFDDIGIHLYVEDEELTEENTQIYDNERP